jgi:hypothetical protein
MIPPDFLPEVHVNILQAFCYHKATGELKVSQSPAVLYRHNFLVGRTIFSQAVLLLIVGNKRYDIFMK